MPTEIKPYTNYKLDYYREYTDQTISMMIGKRLVDDCFMLEGKTRFQDDTTGKEVTGLIEVHKLKLVSNMSIILGENASPFVPRFQAIGYPVGVKGNSEVARITFLKDDIDSDIQ